MVTVRSCWQRRVSSVDCALTSAAVCARLVAFYLRKSFRLGPLRLNLSKRGVGVSAGVTGARIGVDATGREYVHAGRRGLYYRAFGPRVASSGGVLLVWLIGGLLVVLAVFALLTG
jgi:hypothetical protein